MQRNNISSELDEFLQEIKSGEYEFSTRHQEDCWGIRYSKKNEFEFWSENYQTGICTQSFYSESALREKLVIYKVETLLKGLITVQKI
jgi:hypothetical protein